MFWGKTGKIVNINHLKLPIRDCFCEKGLNMFRPACQHNDREYHEESWATPVRDFGTPRMQHRRKS